MMDFGNICTFARSVEHEFGRQCLDKMITRMADLYNDWNHHVRPVPDVRLCHSKKVVTLVVFFDLWKGEIT